MFSPLYLKIFEKSPFLMKTPTQNFAHHTEVKKHPFGVKTPILATLLILVDSSDLLDRSSQLRIFFIFDAAVDVRVVVHFRSCYLCINSSIVAAAAARQLSLLYSSTSKLQ